MMQILVEANETDTDDKVFFIFKNSLSEYIFKFYAVARGRIIGIFKDMDTVKKNVKIV